MSLLAPLFLFGLLAALLPWWLHRLSASNPPQADFGSTRFLEETISTSSKKRHTRYWWLLALRVLFVALLSLLFAQPVLERLRAAGTSNVRHILLIDTSLSQNLSGRWAKSLEIANDILDQASSADQAIVISASDRFVQSQSDTTIESARAQLGSLTPQNTRLDYGRIASAVASATANPADSNNHLHIITDAQASALPDRFTSLAVDRVQKLNVYSSASTGDSNTSVTGKLEASRDDTANVVAIVNNYGSNTSRTLQVLSDNVALASKELSLTANSNIVHRFENLDISEATTQLTLKISPQDSLAEDDSWRLPLPNKDKTELTIIVSNNEPSVSGTYVKAAIESDVRFKTRILEADRFTKSDAGNLIIVPDASALSDRAAGRLRDYVEEGGNVLVAVGSTPHSAAARSLLGVTSQSQSRQSSRQSSSQSTKGNGVGAIDQSHQSTSGLESNWRSISIIQHHTLEPKITDRSIIELSDGSPLLIEKRIGAGKMLLLATALDTRWTDLPTDSVFVAFVIKSIDYLGGDIAATSYRSTGDAISVSSGAQLLDPGGEPMRDLSQLSDRTSVRLDTPGIYQLRNSAGIQSIAVNSDARESDITTIDDSTLNDWQQTGNASSNTTTLNQPSDKSQKSFWLWLLPLLLVVALLESLYSHRHLWIRREA